MIDPAERAAVAGLHRAGLLGVTAVGWFIAAVYSGIALGVAVRQRFALLALQAGQALVFQLAAGAILFGLIGAVCGGFLVLGGANDYLPELPAIDPFSVTGVVVIALWLASIAALPTWYVWTLLIARRAARRSAQGEVYAYPFVGQLVWDEAPRIWKWMVIEPTTESEPIESPE